MSLIPDEWRSGGPGQSRTADQRFRKPLLYPSELRGQLDVVALSHGTFPRQKWPRLPLWRLFPIQGEARI